MLAGEALARLGLDEVLLMPAAAPPHKPGGAHLPAELRARLVALAAAGVPGLSLSRLELERGGPSYTADSLEALRAAEPEAGLWFLLGADQLVRLAGWHAPERIVAAARLGAVARGGELPSLTPALERLAAGRTDWIDMPRVDVSSSDVRARIAAGRPVDHLLPAAVARELRLEGLVPLRDRPEQPSLRKDRARPHSS